MKKLTAILTTCLFLLLTACGGGQRGNAQEVESAEERVLFAGGNGTEADPYRIETGAQLQELASGVNSGENAGYAGAFFVLTEDVNLSGVDWTPIGTMKDFKGYSTVFRGGLRWERSHGFQSELQHGRLHYWRRTVRNQRRSHSQSVSPGRGCGGD